MTDRESLLAEQEFLLASLEDLESERAAGDLDDADYAELKNDYTVRTARVTRQIRGLGSASAPSSSGRRRRLGWFGALAVFGVAAGWLLAMSAGERGVNDQLTGTIEESPRQQVFRCQQMGQEPSMLLESFECFDDVLERDPENAEALTYRGWYGVLASGSAQLAGEDAAAVELLASAGVYLNRAVQADPTYPDARAFRMVVLERLGATDDACADYAALLELDPPEMIGQLVAPVAQRLSCPGG